MTHKEALQLAKTRKHFLRDHPEWKSNKEVVMMSVQHSAEGLSYADPVLRADEEVVLAAVQFYSFSLGSSLVKEYPRIFDDLVKLKGNGFLFSCCNNFYDPVRLKVAEHPEFCPTIKQIEIGMKDKNKNVRRIYSLRKDEWLSKIEENKLRNNI